LSAVKAANLALRFLLELCALAAVAYWGAQVSSSTAVNIVVAVAAPLVLATLWGLFLAPKASRRVELPGRWPFELAVLAAAVVALVAAGSPLPAVLLAVIAVLNAVLLHAWGLDVELTS
jgi:hypothetical protein